MIKNIARVAGVLLLAAGVHGACRSAAVAAPAGAPVYASVSENTIATPPKMGTPPKTVKGAKTVTRTSALTKKAAPAPGQISTMAACSPTCYYYSGGDQIVTNWGVSGYINLKKPFVASAAQDGSARHSLAEIVVGNSGSTNSVEFGWTVDPVLNGDSNPHMFSFWTKNGVAQGYNSGFVDYGPNAVNVGSSLLSDVDTTSDQFVVQFDAAGGANNWWMAYKGQWIGYFPGTNWPSPNTFTAGAYIQVFGEVASTISEPCSDMGTGIQGNPYSGSNGSAKMSGGGPLTTPSSVGNFSLYSDTVGYSTALFTGYTQAFTYGGPGWNSAHAAVGSATTC